MPSVNKKSQRPPWFPEKVAFEGAKGPRANQAFYNSSTWRRLRAYFIAQFPLCAICYENGLVEAATVCDHIIPIEEGGARLDPANLQSLCARCHNSKSSKEGHLRHYAKGEKT